MGVNHGTLETHGAVSEETVIEMVKGAMKSMNSDCAVATSGIAGPTGGTPDKPVGTIWIAAGCKDKVITLKLEGDEGRNKTKEETKTLQMQPKMHCNCFESCSKTKKMSSNCRIICKNSCFIQIKVLILHSV